MSTSIIVPLDESRATDDQGVGSRVEFNGSVYLWVLMDYGTDTPAVGDALGYHASTYTGYTVNPDASECIADWLAGAIQSTTQQSGYTVPGDGEYFWMLVKGPHTASNTIADSAAAGDRICLDSASDGTFGKSGASEPNGGVMVVTTTLVLDCNDYVYSA